MGKVIITRHGETPYNIEKKYTGQTDVPLTEKGIMQAATAAEQLQYHNIDIIISSPLQRARKTAEIIAEKLDKPVVILDEFTERASGIMEGMTKDEVDREFAHLGGNKSIYRTDFTPEGGEAIPVIKERVINGLKKVKESFPHQDILIVTHSFVTKIIHTHFNNLDDSVMPDYKLGNCEISEYKVG